MGARDSEPNEGMRRAERLPVDEATRLRPNSWSSLEVRIVNLSRSGFQAECDARLMIGGCVSLDVQGIGAVDAQVEWRRGTLFGAKFLHPICIERCAWVPGARKPVLAELLVDRARAGKAGRVAAERRIRQKILHGLPMRMEGGSSG